MYPSSVSRTLTISDSFKSIFISLSTSVKSIAEKGMLMPKITPNITEIKIVKIVFYT